MKGFLKLVLVTTAAVIIAEMVKGPIQRWLAGERARYQQGFQK